jgi:YidC/Oxa1 family membrane protein insertase
MFSGLFHNFLYLPIYNLLVFLVDVIPGGDVGIAVVLATVIVKLVLMPLSLRAVTTQRRMKLIEPKLKELKEKYKSDRERQAKEMLALYREHEIKPFSSILGILIQLPIVIALYFVFSREALLNIDPALLYSFVPVPTAVSPLFLGVFPVVEGSIALAVIAALAQFAHAHLSVPLTKKVEGEKRSTAEDLGHMMALQARFVLPFIIGVIGFITSGAVAIYFITSSLVGILQEFVVRNMKHPEPVSAV